MRILALSIILTLFGCSCSHTPQTIDTESAVESNDFTAILSGCGQQLAGSGYLVCRQTEATSTHQEYIVIHTPPNLDCSEEACTFVKVFFPDGKPSLEKSIPRGKAFVKIPWNELTGKDVFDLTDRGFYAVSITTHYMNGNQELKTYADGMIFMHVVKKGYTSLIDSESDENFRWIWKTDHNQTLKVTTGYRVYVEPSLTTQKQQAGSSAL